MHYVVRLRENKIGTLIQDNHVFCNGYLSYGEADSSVRDRHDELRTLIIKTEQFFFQKFLCSKLFGVSESHLLLLTTHSTSILE